MPVTFPLARFLHKTAVMDLRSTVRGMPWEARVDQASGLVLIVLLLATLASIV